MYTMNGENYSSREDYNAVVKDREIIAALKKQYDLSKPSDVLKCYSAIQNINFKSEEGRKFDDFIFDLKNSDKVADIYSKSEASNNSKTKKEASDNKKKKEKSKKTGLKTENTSINVEITAQVMREIKKRNTIRSLIICALLLLSVTSIGYFVVYYKESSRAEAQARELAALKDVELPETIKVEQVLKKNYSEEVVIPEILDEYKAPYNQNKSLIGWITIEGTKIDYPVMQTVNNEYYLTHNFNQQEDANGCIFLDTNCDIILGCTNYIVYGHHMNSGKMFGSLINYGNKDYYLKHDTISFDTIYEKGTYKIMYVFRSHIYNADEITFKYYQFINANSEAEFNSAMEEMAQMSLYDTGVYAHYGDQLLTLSTCDYQQTNGRFVVVAKRVN